MLEALQKIESLSLSLSTGVMAAIGGVLVLAGLFVWLGGIRWHFLSAILAGGFAGLVTASFTTPEYQPQAFGLAAVMTVIMTAIFRKRSLVFVASLVIVYSILFVGSLSSMNASGEWNLPEIPELADSAQNYTPEETLSILADNLLYFASEISTHIKGSQTSAIAFASVTGFVILIVGFFFARIVSSVGTAILGTFYVFAGMIFLLLQKGSVPFTGLYHKPLFFQTIIICMIILGSVCGLLLCPIGRIKPIEDRNKEGDKK